MSSIAARLSHALDRLEALGALPVVSPTRLAADARPTVQDEWWDRGTGPVVAVAVTLVAVGVLMLLLLYAPSAPSGFIYQNF